MLARESVVELIRILNPSPRRVNPRCFSQRGLAQSLATISGVSKRKTDQEEDPFNAPAAAFVAVSLRSFACSVNDFICVCKNSVWIRTRSCKSLAWVSFCANPKACLLYTSDAADEEDSVDLGGR